jgi:uncharacterized protein YdeI (YjbR/CyaY-like superfamily)
MTPRFFEKVDELRLWFATCPADCREVWIGFYKKGVSPSGLSYEQVLDEAICFGWVDVLVRGVDARSYMLRFVPRKAKGSWNASNLQRAAALIEQGRMQPSGLAAYESRKT